MSGWGDEGAQARRERGAHVVDPAMPACHYVKNAGTSLLACMPELTRGLANDYNAW